MQCYVCIPPPHTHIQTITPLSQAALNKSLLTGMAFVIFECHLPFTKPWLHILVLLYYIGYATQLGLLHLSPKEMMDAIPNESERSIITYMRQRPWKSVWNLIQNLSYALLIASSCHVSM